MEEDDQWGYYDYSLSFLGQHNQSQFDFFLL